MIRLFSLRGDLGRATATLDQMVAQQIKPKLRSVAPFLAAACERGDLGLATQAAPSHSRPTLACARLPFKLSHRLFFALTSASLANFGWRAAWTPAEG